MEYLFLGVYACDFGNHFSLRPKCLKPRRTRSNFGGSDDSDKRTKPILQPRVKCARPLATQRRPTRWRPGPRVAGLAAIGAAADA